MVSVKHNNIYLFYIILTASFGRLTIIRPSLQKSEQGACCADNIYEMWDPIKLAKCIKIIYNDWF
jgi:hypothetical protein